MHWRLFTNLSTRLIKLLKDRIGDCHSETYLQDMLVSVEELRHSIKGFKPSNTNSTKFRSAVRQILGLDPA